MQQEEWFVMRKDNPEIAQPAEPAEAPPAMGGAATTGQAVTIAAGSGGLEVLDQAEIELRKEELVVGKREVSNGGLLVRTIVQTEEVSKPIELRREEYVIERIPAGSQVDKQYRAENAFQGREIYIPLMKEEALSGKRTLLTEAIKIGKRVETDQQTISMPVRSEDIQIVKDPSLSDPKFATVPRRTPSGALVTRSTTPATEEPGMLKLAREELVVGKQEVDAGGVYLQKVIQTTTASEPVALRREEAFVERAPITGEAAPDFTPRQITVDLSREEAVAGTRNYVAEVIRVRKQMQTDQQLVAGTIRKETVEVVNLAQGGTSAEPQVTVISESAPLSKDDALSQQVHTALLKGICAPQVDCANVTVTSNDGVVTLIGTVPTAEQKKTLGKEVKKMTGVRSVKNELKVQAP
jgi:uncharacterized protein (TIGR02271 family)